MKKHAMDTQDYNDVGKAAEEHNQADDPVKRSDIGRNDERNKLISQEKKTAGIQRQSIKEAQKNRYRPLL